MELNIVTNKANKFHGYINDVQFTNEDIFYTVKEILSDIEDEFGDAYNNDFIKDLSNSIEKYILKHGYFFWAEFVADVEDDIRYAKSFSEIEFTPLSFDKEFHDKLSRWKYDAAVERTTKNQLI